MRGVPAKTPERVAEAQLLRAQGVMYREIAERFGISTQTAHAWVNDPDGSLARQRKRRYDLECVLCGGRVDGTSPGKMHDPANPVCLDCAPGHYAVWTRDAIVLCIQEWADEHGGVPPAACDFLRARAADLPVPSVNNVQRRFGSWNEAIRAAGFEPHHPGPLGGFTMLSPEQRAECARRYAAGESSTLIAADLGCQPQTVIKWARKAGVPIREAFAARQDAA